MSSYGPIWLALLTATLLGWIIVVSSYLLVDQNPDAEKVSVYECGFNPYGDARQKFEVRFFLVGILFIIFDLEISLLVPYSVSLNTILLEGVLTVLVFLLILTYGLVIEWHSGALEWQ